MPELPTPPFPELSALDQRSAVPSLADLLRGTHAANLPLPALPLPAPLDVPKLDVARFPAPVPPSVFQAKPEPEPERSLPENNSQESAEAASASTSSNGAPEEQTVHLPDDSPAESMEATIAALLANEFGTPPSGKEHHPQEADPPPGESDHDLAQALAPFIEGAFHQTLCHPEMGLQSILEPMLRNTVRRALAEQMESSRQFRQLGALDRLSYRLRALVSSRTYDDIVFERTHRYQVEEAYLLRRKDYGLISYAHHDPGCHVSERRVQERVRDLSARIQSPDGGFETSFDLSKHRLALLREGQFSLLVAVLRGRPNALVRADLDYVLRQAEDRFGPRLEIQTDAFIRVLQPILEGCLLILSPAPPH